MFDRSATYQTGPENRWEFGVSFVVVISSLSAEYVRCTMYNVGSFKCLKSSLRSPNTAYWNGLNGPKQPNAYVYNYWHNLCFIDCMFDSTGSMLANLERIKYDQFIVILIVFYALYKSLTADANGKKFSFSFWKGNKKKWMAEPETNIFLFSSLDGWVESTVYYRILLSYYVFFQDLLRADSCFQEFKQANQISLILILLLYVDCDEKCIRLTFSTANLRSGRQLKLLTSKSLLGSGHCDEEILMNTETFHHF